MSDAHNQDSFGQKSSAVLSSQNDFDEFNSKKVEAIPLMSKGASSTNSNPPLAKAEIDDDLKEALQIFEKPNNGANNNFGNSEKSFYDDGEKSFTAVSESDENNESHIMIDGDNKGDVPNLFSRAGETDEGDGKKPPESTRVDLIRRDVEFGIGAFSSDTESIPDVNVYQHKKTLAQGMMDLALFSANANQLRYVLESSNQHPYYYPSIVLISFSLCFQIAVGIGLIWNATYNVKDEKQICIANKINNFTIIGIFLVTIINVFISAFGVAAPARVG